MQYGSRITILLFFCAILFFTKGFTVSPSLYPDLSLLHLHLEGLDYRISSSGNSPSYPTISLKPTTLDIQHHLATMGELKSNVHKRTWLEEKERAQKQLIQPVNSTQTSALFIFDWFKKLIRETFSPQPHAKIILEIFEKEKEYFHTHYPFYHAQDASYRIYQDLFRKLYEFFYVSGEVNNFSFLRLVRPEEFDSYRNISDFLKDQLKTHGIINDNLTSTKTVLLSVNVSPFGNPRHPGEATWHYFQTSLSWTKPDVSFYQKILAAFDCSEAYIEELVQLSNSIQTKEGSLFQIFIPRNKVDQYVYLAVRQGVPHNADLLKALFKITRKKLTENSVLEYQRLWKADALKDQTVQKLLEEILEKINNGDIKISTILNQYTQDPHSLPGIERLQARILLNPDLLLNPTSNVIIFRYTTIPLFLMEEYEQKLNEIVDKIIKQWINMHVVQQAGKTNKTRAEKLFQLVAEQTGITK